MPDLQGLLAQAQQMQEQMASAQQELAQLTVQGRSGGGLVVATLSGLGELVDLTIDPSVVDPQDTETLAALVIAAVRDASVEAQGVQEQAMGPLAATDALGLPGI
ncbi:MAG: YbaB/EbfC family nucleoid-associated protein [Actinomycetes bacterium]